MYPQDIIKSILDEHVDDEADDQVSNAELARLISIALAAANAPRPRAEWHEDIGPVLWWVLPVEEPPYVGTPLDLPRSVIIPITTGLSFNVEGLGGGGWPGYHTHWTPLPPVPIEPSK